MTETTEKGMFLTRSGMWRCSADVCSTDFRAFPVSAVAYEQESLCDATCELTDCLISYVKSGLSNAHGESRCFTAPGLTAAIVCHCVHFIFF